MLLKSSLNEKVAQDDLNDLSGLRDDNAAVSEIAANVDALPMVFAMSLELAGFNHVSERIHRLTQWALRLTESGYAYFYLYKDRRLILASSQKPDMLKDLQSHNHWYQKIVLPVDDTSLAGSSAAQGRMLFVPDMRNFPADIKCDFNPRHENIHNYKTVSTLTIPLIDEYERLLGVLQLVNLGRCQEIRRPLSANSWLAMLQNASTQILAQGLQMHSNTMRTLGVVQLHDPRETLDHVTRLGAYAAELYQALNPHEDEEQLAKYRDMVRIAAMYHDLGKVAVPSAILQKAGPLDLREFLHMQSHTIKGAGLFMDGDTELDRVCVEVMLNHHENWDGSGYPGYLATDNPGLGILGSGKKGDEIPLFARIVALVDVYDALSTRSAHKEAWPEEAVLENIKAGSGRLFDPQVVEAFFDIYDVIKAIRLRHPN